MVEKVAIAADHSIPRGIAEGLHYNFVKPHAALEGQTPAERAGVGVKGENKWPALLMKSLSQTKEGIA